MNDIILREKTDKGVIPSLAPIYGEMAIGDVVRIRVIDRKDYASVRGGAYDHGRRCGKRFTATTDADGIVQITRRADNFPGRRRVG